MPRRKLRKNTRRNRGFNPRKAHRLNYRKATYIGDRM